MKKITKTYRLPKVLTDKVKDVADKEKVTQTAVIELSIYELLVRIGAF